MNLSKILQVPRFLYYYLYYYIEGGLTSFIPSDYSSFTLQNPQQRRRGSSSLKKTVRECVRERVRKDGFESSGGEEITEKNDEA